MGTDIHSEVLGQIETVQDREALRGDICRRNAWRLVPVLAVAYVISYLDRSNVGFAGLTMRKDLGLTATQFGWGAGIFAIGYCAFAVPSNLAMYRLGARRWLAWIMIAWGLIASLSAFAIGPMTFYAARFLLGVAEAGFVPGVIFYLTVWFPDKYRAQVLAWFMVALPVSFFIGGPISGYLVGFTRTLGLVGWQWMFVVEGIPASLVGIAVLYLLEDEPKRATWLSHTERNELISALAEERHDKASARLLDALKDPRVLVLSGISFGYTAGSNAVGIWLPQILREYKLSTLQIGFLSAVPYFFATAGMLVWAWLVDRSGRRIQNLTSSCFIAGLAFVFSLEFKNLTLGLICFTVALVGISSARAIFFTIPQRFLTGAAVATGLAFVNAVASIGAFVGPFLLGWLRDATGSFVAGMMSMAAMLLVASALSVLLMFFPSVKRG